jgi:hypothetical protein
MSGSPRAQRVSRELLGIEPEPLGVFLHNAQRRQHLALVRDREKPGLSFRRFPQVGIVPIRSAGQQKNLGTGRLS